VNRNAVREGLKRLEQAGLVAIQQGGPTRVLDFRRTAGLELIASLVIRPDGSIATDVVRGVVELRSVLAPAVGRFAAERRAREDVAAVEEVVRAMDGAAGDVPRLMRLALDFWKCVVAGTKNVAFQLAFNSLEISYGAVLEPLRALMADEVSSTADYAALSDAIRARDGDRAATVSTKITARGARAFESMLDQAAANKRARRKP
jgi:DNA-binding FadR family transcriptional regulator